MSLTVGIHSNIIFAKGERNDRGTLVVGFKKVEEVDVIALMNGSSSSTAFAAPEQDFLIFPPKVENMKGEIDSAANILKKIAEVKDPLTHILQQYLPNSEIRWDIMKNTGIDKTNMERKLTSQNVLDIIYNNIADQFVAMAKPILEGSGASRKLRAVFIRQSKTKPFAGLRKRFLESNPIFEPMEVSEAASKLGFSKFERENGLDSGEPISEQTVIDQNESAAADAALMS